MSAPLRWGIVGCGAVTELKSGPAFSALPGSSLQAVMRRDGAKAQDYARRHAVPRWYDDAQALIDDPQVDVVYVATPPSSHKLYALRAIAAGKPVYIEKPMALDTDECRAIVAAGNRAGVPVYVAYYRRALPRFELVRQLLADGVIGPLRQVEVAYQRPHDAAAYADPAKLPWRVRPEISGGGLFVDLGCHTLDLLDWLLGPLTDVEGLAASATHAYPAEDSVVMSFACRGGVIGSGVWNFAGDRREDRVELIGEQGRLSFATFGDGPIRCDGPAGRREFHIENPGVIQRPLIASIVAELRGEGGCCPSRGDSAMRTTSVIDQVLAGYRRHAAP